ncbi:MAG: ATP-dependent RecD-like DNA helicase [Simkaniaceae bacterium]
MDDQISGIVERVVFSNQENGFTIARLKEPRKEDLTTIVGSMPELKAGEALTLQGIWKHHPQYGRQFDVKLCDFKAPTDQVGIQKYLESGLIKGIGPVFAARIVKLFGTETLNIIDKSPGRLNEVEGMGEKRIDLIKQCWQDQKAIRELIIFLRQHDVSPLFAQKIFRRYGEESLEIVKKDPYRLAKEINGVGFKTADKMAQLIGVLKDSPKRIEAFIEYLLWELTGDGHVCYPKTGIIKKGIELLQIEEQAILPSLDELEGQGRIVRYPINEEDLIWIKPLYLSEVGIGKELKRLLTVNSEIRTIDEEKALVWVQEKLNIQLASEQIKAVSVSLTQKIHILTGGPGTGKSTITNAIIKILEKITGKIVLAAPTGRAAKRMSEITGYKAQTIHSLLEFDFQAGGFKRNHDNPLSGALFLFDEASMIDTRLMHYLLRAIPDKARIIFIGDIDQLPSVGPGNVLKDLIATEKIPVTCLKKIFRQAQGSKIVTNAHRINQGVFPDVSRGKKDDFIFIPVDEPDDILQKIASLVSQDIPNHFELDPINDIQVLSPMKKGGIGIENLNHHLQELLNPNRASVQRMGITFREGDKVMQMRNNYNKLVFNGDVGRIIEIIQEDQFCTIDFDGQSIEYDFSELDELSLAYACSIHKYQGSECPCVVIPIHTCHYKMLNRNLLYTGITRGKKLVVLVGSKRALMISVQNDEVKKRFTGLKEIVCEFL